MNVFDFWSGADFELKIRNVAGYRNYDKSDFKSPAALAGADETQLEAIYNTLYDLNEFIVPNYPNAHDANWFKSYDDLKAKLETVLGLATGAGATVRNEAVATAEEAPPWNTADEPTIVAAALPPHLRLLKRQTIHYPILHKWLRRTNQWSSMQFSPS